MRSETVLVGGVAVQLVPTTGEHTECCTSRELINQVARHGHVTSLTKVVSVPEVTVMYNRRAIATITKNSTGWWKWGSVIEREREVLISRILRYSGII